MLRSMYSAVSGMRAHQQRMDVIGNNIANVNTYGFKGSRATFRDVYYQTTQGASSATAVSGGTNPSQVGYGAKVGSVDVLQTRAAMAATDNGMDLAIQGEGFFQVQDSDGNIFYTRAGLLNVDAQGNVVDMNGNFVLGVNGNPIGKDSASDKIQISVPSVQPAVARGTEVINGATFTFTGSNTSKDANVALNIISDPNLPIGQPAEAEITQAGITIKLNKDQRFDSVDALEDAINAAILNANGGKEHPIGTLDVGVEPADKFLAFNQQNNTGGLTGEQIASNDFSPILGSVAFPKNTFGSLTFKEVGTQFSGTFAQGNSNITITSGNPPIVPPGQLTAGDPIEIEITLNGVTYEQTIKDGIDSSGTIKLQNNDPDADPNDYIILTHGGHQKLEDFLTNQNPNTNTATVGITGATPTEQSKNLGLSARPIKLKDGTEGGPQTVADLSSIGFTPEGYIEGVHPIHGRMLLGRIDIVTFANPQGLEQAGNTYFKATGNSGDPNVTQAGTQGSGALTSGALEMSNVDLSREFSEMITTQRGFQANSRLITVSDEILQELVNLKR